MAEPAGKALRNRTRVQILAACSEGETTVEEFAKRHKVSVRAANNNFRALEKDGLLRRRVVQARGLRSYVYSAVKEPIVSDSEFDEMREKERRKLTATVIWDLFKRLWAAWKAGTLDGRSDSHLTWLPLHLDTQGWREAIDLLTRVLEALYEIQARATARMRKTGEPSISTVFSLAGFEAACDDDAQRLRAADVAN